MSSVRETFRWLRFHGNSVRLGGMFLSVVLSILCVGWFDRSPNGFNIIWLANGLILAYLLLVPRWRWASYMTAGFAAMVVGSWMIGETVHDSLLFNGMNLLELSIGAFLLKRKSTDLPSFTNGWFLLRFLAYACILGPGITAILMGISARMIDHRSFLTSAQSWFMADSLGIGVITPTFVAIFQSRMRNAHLLKQRWIYPVLMVASTVLVFSQNRVPILFLVFPFLILMLIQIDLGWAAMSTLMVAVVGGWYTVHHSGPLALTAGINAQTDAAIFQLYLAAQLCSIFSVSVVFSNLRITQTELRRIVALHQLVMDNSRDVVVLGTLDGRQTYVSPGIKAVSGWDPRDLEGKVLQEIIHPTDLMKVNLAMSDLLSGSAGGILEYRVRKKEGEYFWAEANLRLYRDAATNLPIGFLNLVRDINNRKISEEQSQAAYQVMETLVVVDALTGIANRRRFDDALATEWRRSLRLNSKLSLLMIDVDHFKLFNDTYGHVRGDRCLKQIAEAALDVVVRPADLVARYGGEEFAVVLPGTDEDGAKAVAEDICEAVRKRIMPHEGNPRGIVTVSIGCATVVPHRLKSGQELIESADRALYSAKRNGRDRVVAAPGAALPQLDRRPSTAIDLRLPESPN